MLGGAGVDCIMRGGGCTWRFTVIELSLSSDPARLWRIGLTNSLFVSYFPNFLCEYDG